MTNLLGSVTNPDSEIAALQGGFFVFSAGRRITPGCDNSPPYDDLGVADNKPSQLRTGKIAADQLLKKLLLVRSSFAVTGGATDPLSARTSAFFADLHSSPGLLPNCEVNLRRLASL
jgi:hypothetical protein